MLPLPPNELDQHAAARGTIVQLWRYPVKSMLGEQRACLDLKERGVEGDRLFAIRTVEGKFGSGKSTRRFHHIAGLFGFRAIYQDDIPEITFPEGEVIQGNDPLIHMRLSHTLGQPVTLAKEGAISHFDAGPVHLLTTAALAWLRMRLPRSVVDERRFRPNLLVDVPSATPIEHHWCGRTLAVGDTVRLRINIPTERCVMVAFAQPDLPKDPQMLRFLAQETALQFGVYADVVVPGAAMIGDRVRIVD